MGASIWMRGGTIKKSTGPEVDITPGWRSQAVARLSDFFGPLPCEVTQSELSRLTDFGRACEVYTSDEDNIWKKIEQGVSDHGCVVIGVEY